jgi:hypothetical protein
MSELLNSGGRQSSRLYCLKHPNIRLLLKWDDFVIEDELYCPICSNTFKRIVLIEKSPKIINLLIWNAGIPLRYLDI